MFDPLARKDKYAVGLSTVRAHTPTPSSLDNHPTPAQITQVGIAFSKKRKRTEAATVEDLMFLRINLAYIRYFVFDPLARKDKCAVGLSTVPEYSPPPQGII